MASEFVVKQKTQEQCDAEIIEYLLDASRRGPLYENAIHVKPIDKHKFSSIEKYVIFRRSRVEFRTSGAPCINISDWPVGLKQSRKPVQITYISLDQPAAYCSIRTHEGRTANNVTSIPLKLFQFQRKNDPKSNTIFRYKLNPPINLLAPTPRNNYSFQFQNDLKMPLDNTLNGTISFHQINDFDLKEIIIPQWSKTTLLASTAGHNKFNISRIGGCIKGFYVAKPATIKNIRFIINDITSDGLVPKCVFSNEHMQYFSLDQSSSLQNLDVTSSIAFGRLEFVHCEFDVAQPQTIEIFWLGLNIHNLRHYGDEMWPNNQYWFPELRSVDSMVQKEKEATKTDEKTKDAVIQDDEDVVLEFD